MTDEFEIYDEVLKPMRSDISSKVVFAHFNVSSVRNKFLFLVKQFEGNTDILMILEIGDSFPPGNFLIDGYSKPCKLDRNSIDGILFMKEMSYPTLLPLKRNLMKAFMWN